MDATDHALFGLLRKDARKPVATLALKRGEPGVLALHDTNGRRDLMAELRAESNAALSAMLSRARLVKGMADTETRILLATFR